MRFEYDPKWHKKSQDVLKQLLIDLLESDQPLDSWTRAMIAGHLRRFFFSDSTPTKKEWRHIQDRTAHELIRRLRENCGMTAGDAEQHVATELGISIDALRQRLQRLRRPRTPN
jgi:hypothetical protein